MKKFFLVAWCSLTATATITAQNEVDALRYSMYQFGGTARNISMAGTLSALGGDVSCAAVNPAGMARFTRSDFSFGFNYLDANSQGYFNESGPVNNGRNHFNLSHFSLVGAFDAKNSSDWKTIQFGIVYQRYANYNQKFTFEGANSSSLLDAFVNEANGVNQNYLLDERPFYAGVAYFAYLIDPLDTIANTYISAIPDGQVNVSRTVERTGSMNETDFVLSANYMDKVYFGATLGIPGMRFNEEWSHRETPVDTSLSIQDFTFQQSLITRGTGINLKAGIMVLPKPWLRIGLAFHTPTGLSLTDKWATAAYGTFNFGDESWTSTAGNYSYHLRTPGRIIGTLGVVIKKYGSIGIEVEQVNYARAKLRSTALDPDNYSFYFENTAIQNYYRNTLNFKVGGELRLNPIYLRAGYAHYGSPMKDVSESEVLARQVYTGGIGYKNRIFYIDLGFAMHQWKDSYYPYDPELTAPGKVKTVVNSFTLSGGITF
jgi:long-subunit fatty acid transport protein